MEPRLQAAPGTGCGGDSNQTHSSFRERLLSSIDIDGVKIAYDLAGEGPAVVLVHGLGTNRHIWAAQVAVLAKHFRVLSFDLPGAGQSSDDPGGYSIPRWVGQIHRLTHALVPGGRFTLAGHSMGTVTAVRFAIEHADRVTALMLIGMLTGPAPGLAERAKKVEAEGMAAVVEAVLAGQLTAGAREGNPALTGLLRAVLSANRPGPYAGHCRTLEAFSTAADLPRVSVPALLMVGDQDVVTPLKNHVGFKSAIPRAELAVVASAAHTPQVERPDAVALRMLEFLIRL